MINHVRTLLMNVSGGSQPGADFLGEQLVPAGYTAVELDANLTRVRRILFGVSPDRVMLNYRLWQLMLVLHATELEEYVLALDTRVTYLNDLRNDLFGDASFRPRVASSDATRVYFGGSPEPPDATGRARHRFDVTADATPEITVRRMTPPASTTVTPVSVSGGLLTPVSLTGSGYTVQMGAVGDSRTVVVEVLNRPQWSLGSLNAALHEIGEPVLLSLFGTSRDEPYMTLRELFFDHPYMPYQLGAAVIALAYRTESVRLRENDGQG